LKSFFNKIKSILKAKMEFQQINSFMFYSALRSEMVYQFGPLVESSWLYGNYVEIVYVDGRREQVLYPFSEQMMIDNGGGNIEEEKENEEEEQEEEEEHEVAHPVSPQGEPNDDEDETDNEDPDEEEPNDEYLQVVIEP
jgi:hypothetical protein